MAQIVGVGGGQFGLGSAYANQMNVNRQLSMQEREQAQRELQFLAQLQLQRQAAQQAQASDVQRMGLEYAKLGAQENANRMQMGSAILQQREAAERQARQQQMEMDFRQREAAVGRDFQMRQQEREQQFRAGESELDRAMRQKELQFRQDEAQATQKEQIRQFDKTHKLAVEQAARDKERREDEKMARQIIADERKAKLEAERIKAMDDAAQKKYDRAIEAKDVDMLTQAKNELNAVAKRRDALLRAAELADQIGPPVPPELEESVRPSMPENAANREFAERTIAEKKKEEEAERLKSEVELGNLKIQKEFNEEKLREFKKKSEYEDKIRSFGVDPAKVDRMEGKAAVDFAEKLKGEGAGEDVINQVLDRNKGGARALWNVSKEEDPEVLLAKRRTLENTMAIQEPAELRTALQNYQTVTGASAGDMWNAIEKRMKDLNVKPQALTARQALEVGKEKQRTAAEEKGLVEEYVTMTMQKDLGKFTPVVNLFRRAVQHGVAATGVPGFIAWLAGVTPGDPAATEGFALAVRQTMEDSGVDGKEARALVEKHLLKKPARDFRSGR